MRIMICGGFEKSGHDGAAAAISEAAGTRGHECNLWTWRDHADISDLLIFNVHRVGVELGMPEITELTKDERFLETLAAELAEMLTAQLSEYDAIISVHPWSTQACAIALADSTIPLIDCHVEFSPFPVFPLKRVSAYTGTFQPRPLPLQHRRDLHLLGLPVRRDFACNGTSKMNMLAVNLGATGWFREKCFPYVVKAVKGLGVEAAVLLSPELDEDYRSRLQAQVDCPVNWPTADNVASTITQSEWLLTKPGGAPVAEGLAAGCKIVLVPSGIPWEEEARRELLIRHCALDSELPLSAWRNAIAILQERTELRRLIRAAASSIISLAEQQLYEPNKLANNDYILGKELERYLCRTSRTRVLPRASDALVALVREYIWAD